MINFPIFLKFEDGTIKSYESYDDIEQNVEYFLIKEEKCKVFDSKGKELVLNVFLNEVQDLYPVK